MMVEERKKTMRHFYSVIDQMLLMEKNENKNLILPPVERVPERHHGTCESVHQATYKKYSPSIGVALERIVNNSANAATNQPITKKSENKVEAV